MSQFAVNGKTPIAVWCPSRDDVGNGTTTLRDLTGNGRNGTLTNMDPATDWVADTGASGVRALDFDGSNDRVDVAGVAFAAYTFSVSCWARTSSTANQAILNFGTSGVDYIGLGVNDRRAYSYYRNSGTGNLTVTDSVQRSLNSWFNVVCVFASNVSRFLYVNGSIANTDTTNLGFPALASTNTTIGAYRATSAPSFSSFLSGRLDDMRIFPIALDASDVAYLWNSGNGRGRLANTGELFHPFFGLSHPLGV